MKTFKWLVPILYFVFWAFELIPAKKPPLITDLIGSYIGYHAIILHFTIYLILELFTQLESFDTYHTLLVMRCSRFSYSVKQILKKLLTSLLFTSSFYMIYSFVFIYQYGLNMFNDFQLFKVFLICTWLYSFFYFLFNIIQGIIQLLINHSFISILFTFILSIFIYFNIPEILYSIEIFEKVYVYGFHFTQFLQTILIMLIFSFFLSIIYIYLFMRKDLIDNVKK